MTARRVANAPVLTVAAALTIAATGSQGYYQQLFGVLHMVFGGLAFFGGFASIAYMRCAGRGRDSTEITT